MMSDSYAIDEPYQVAFLMMENIFSLCTAPISTFSQNSVPQRSILLILRYGYKILTYVDHVQYSRRVVEKQDER